MSLDELKKMVIGKKLNAVSDVDFETCYPAVYSDEIECDDAEIIDVVCAEFGSETADGDHWTHNGTVAWFTSPHQ